MSTTTRVLQRFVLPADGDSDILALYAEGEVISVAPVTKETRDSDSADVGVAQTVRQSPGQIVSRYSYRIPAQSRSSFGTYFINKMNINFVIVHLLTSSLFILFF